MRLRCLIGLHEWGSDRWRWVEPGVSYYWFRRCRHCGWRKNIARRDAPPSRFAVNKDGVVKEIHDEGSTDSF